MHQKPAAPLEILGHTGILTIFMIRRELHIQQQTLDVLQWEREAVILMILEIWYGTKKGKPL